MLKLLGILLIIVGAGGFGKYLSDCLKKHLEQLIECREIFAQIDLTREYLKLPYAQLLRKTAKGKGKIFCEMLNDVADEMENHRDADAVMIWERALQKNNRYLLLAEEEKDILLALAKSFMLEGNHSQVSKIHFSQLEDKIVKAMEEKKEKQKLYGTVSVLGGLFLIILLL